MMASWSVLLIICCSGDQIKKNEMRGYVARMGEGRGAYGDLWGSLRRRDPLQELGVGEKIILK
jgi:hypothetical protein